MTDGFEIRPFDRTASSDDDLRALWVFTNVMIWELLPDETPIPVEDWMKIVRTTHSTTETLKWVVWDGTGRRVLGSCNLSLAVYDVENATLYISIDPSIRRRGFGRRMLELAAEAADSRGRKVLKTHSNERCPAGASFLENAGARRESESHTNRLLLSDLDEELVKSWLELPRDDCPEFEMLAWHDGIPEDHVEDARDFFQEIYDAEPPREGVPRTELLHTTEMVRDWNGTFTAGGNRSLALAAISRGECRLMGYTMVSWHPSKPGFVNQWFTGVRPGYRHRGLARRLKAEMLGTIRREVPEAESIRTGNDDSNSGILAINRELGFEPFIARTDWALDVATVRARLQDIAVKDCPSDG
ncbi:MAG: GNAT family N-acetyltransferase [Candidatus Fermentibacter sp.]|nr:GNAT family N-acetyltransferase [Candidatus Fermentibacter sp.]